MDAFLTDAANLPYSGQSPVVVAGSSDAAIARATQTVEAAGLRIGASMPIDLACQRIEQQASATALWVEVDRDCGDQMDELLALVSRDVANGRYSAVVSATAGLLDPVSASIDNPAVELVIDADEAERVGTLALAVALRRGGARLADVAADRSAERLRQLSEEVSRIASTLARLSAGPAVSQPPRQAVPAADLPPLSAETVRSVIRARRLRARYFAEELFADPAWDMLLDLLQAEIAQLRVPVSSLCIAAAVPATTALRWLKTMVSQGLFIRCADPHDGRRVFVELAPDASVALRRYFVDVGQVVAI
jgi:hypothetical protein